MPPEPTVQTAQIRGDAVADDPHTSSVWDVIMPALGMAQDSGIVVSWHKAPGDPVTPGDILFDVETDKSTMEVEATHDGFLTNVQAAAGQTVPVGSVIAQITSNPDPDLSRATLPSPTALPDGHEVIMPVLGMAQDSGILVAWLHEPGARLMADEPLFEVETDKSTVEVPAGVDGYFAAQLAQSGEDIPTGQVIAIISPQPVASPIVKSAAATPVQQSAAKSAAETAQNMASSDTVPPPLQGTDTTPRSASTRILASPKARRIALRDGLDLTRLVDLGHPQPFHVKDLDVLRDITDDHQDRAQGKSSPARHLTALVPKEGFSEFAAWARGSAGLDSQASLLAGLAGACMARRNVVVAVHTEGVTQTFDVPGQHLSQVTSTKAHAADLHIQDLRMSHITTLRMGACSAPFLTLTTTPAGLSVTLECAPHHLDAPDAVSLLSTFAASLDDPLCCLL